MRPSLSLLRLQPSTSILSKNHLATVPLALGVFARPIDRVSYSSLRVVGQSPPGPNRRTSLGPLGHATRHLAGARVVLVASSGNFLSLLVIFGLGVSLGFSALHSIRRKKVAQLQTLDDQPVESPDVMSAQIAPGRPGNLTPEQEEKLRRLWQLIFQVCGVNPAVAENGTAEAPPPALATPAVTPAAAAEKTPKKSRLSTFLRRGKKDPEADEPAAAVPASAPAAGTTPSVVLTPTGGEDDKYGQTKHFHDTLASQSPESIRAAIWGMVKHDHPDALALRFLRARKWDVEKALVMLVSTMNWRAQDMKVDDDIMRNGDAAAAEAEKDASDPVKQRLGHDFLQQARMGKSFIHGVDKAGRPICFVRVRLHKQGEQVEESLERYTVYVIETCRYLLQPPIDTATIVFDMTGFSLANMDYTPVKFMIKCFEANYPESLGAVLVHKAPWVFQGIWKVIRGWLDPVVANKVHFTNNVKEMEEFIAPKQLPRELEGEEDWEYAFAEPVPGENDRMKDVATRDRLLAAREELVKEFEEVTTQWIQHPEGDAAADIKTRRTALAAKLREDYWGLDPYIRARSYYDRTGVLQPGGTISYYPEKKEKEKEKEVEVVVAAATVKTGNGAAAAAVVAVPAPAPAAVPVVETSADDVD